MRASVVIFIISTLALAACNDDQSAGESQAARTDATKRVMASADSRSQYSRNDFVLCPALDKYRDELGTLVGIPQNADPNQGAASRLQCILRGVRRGDHLKIEVMPAFLTTSQLQPDNFDAPASRVAELGEHGWYVSDDHLRRIYFTMGSLILMIQAESDPRPSKAQMIAVSKRVNDILAEANP